MTHRKTKIFCIGFHKTGTTSMNAALTMLGYRTTSYFGVWEEDIAETVHAQARAKLDEFDAFEDMPWPCIYPDLDIWVPDSRFILTTRDTDRWYDSVLNHFGGVSNPMREWIYGEGFGAPQDNEEHYKRVYNQHYREVREYFKNRPGDILELSMEHGFSWEPLCEFLREPVPNQPFPKKNTRLQRSGQTTNISIRQALGKIARKIGMR